MKKIDEYIEELYAGIANDDKEALESKEEMRQHLSEEASEYMKNGKSEEESVKLTISKFGDMVEVRKEIRRMFRTQARFSKVILVAALLLLVIGLAGYYQYHVFQKNLTQRYYLEQNGKEGEVPVKIYDVLFGKDDITQADKDAIKKIIDDFNAENGLCYWRVDVSNNHAQNVYSYHMSDIPEEDTRRGLGFDVYKYHPKAPYWQVNIGMTRLYIEKSRLWNAIAEKPKVEYHSFYRGLSPLFIGAYWVLFVVWFVIHSYNKKSLSITGIMLVVLLNILGFIIYEVILKVRRMTFRGNLRHT